MLDDFLKEIKAKNRSKNTMKTLIFPLTYAQKIINKPLEDAEWVDILQYIEQERARDCISWQPRKDPNAPRVERKLSSSTIAGRVSRLMQFYRYCFDETDNTKYRKLLKKLKDFSKPEKNPINPQELLKPEDIKKLINVATLERDRCMVATLFESGMRVGELLALEISMVEMIEGVDGKKQEVIFHIPNKEGCKTGSRSVTCLEVYGYVQDWLKCNPSEIFIDFSIAGVHKVLKKLFNRAGINKPRNPHNFRHSAITHAVSLGMSETQICYRFWGIPHSNMLSIYIHLSEQLQADGYRNAKGMNGDTTKVINPLASRCVVCGRLIQAGELCNTCKENKELKGETAMLKQGYEELKAQMELITAAMVAKQR